MYLHCTLCRVLHRLTVAEQTGQVDGRTPAAADNERPHQTVVTDGFLFAWSNARS